MSGVDVSFHFESVDDESRFVREYLAAAWPRFIAAEYWETGWFWRYSGFADYDSGPDGGFMRLVFDGDPDALVEAERDAWDTVDGLKSWDIRRYEDEGYDSLLDQQRDAKGPEAGEWDYRLKPLLARFVLAAVLEFDDASVCPLLGAGDEGNYGYWVLIHYLMVMSGRDWYGETNASLQAMQNRVYSIAHYRGEEEAIAEYERLADEWSDRREQIETRLDEMETGAGEEP